jgi:hypothetical protein
MKLGDPLSPFPETSGALAVNLESVFGWTEVSWRKLSTRTRPIVECKERSAVARSWEPVTAVVAVDAWLQGNSPGPAGE